MVITEAASGNESVVGLVYVAAFAPDHAESAFALAAMFPGSTLGEALTAYPVTGGGNEVAIRQDAFHQQFAADVPAAQAALMAATQRPVTEAALTEALPTEEPAWKTTPSWFVIADQDRNIPAAVQQFAAKRVGSRSTRQVQGGSHAVAVSHPDEVAESIVEAVDAASR